MECLAGLVAWEIEALLENRAQMENLEILDRTANEDLSDILVHPEEVE